MGKRKQLYSDEESSTRSSEMVRSLDDNEIKSVQTTTHAHTVERFTGTFKYNLYRRLDALKQDKSEWVKHMSKISFQILIQANIALLKSNLTKLGKKKATFWLTGIFEMQPKRIENILI